MLRANKPRRRRLLGPLDHKRARICIVRQSDIYELPLRREAEALVTAGFDVDVICMAHPDRPRRTDIAGVHVISLPSSRRKGSKLRYVFDYLRFFLLCAGTLALRHLRRPYAVVQVNTMPDFLVFAAVVPKLLGSRVLAYMHEPSPELAETIFGPGLLVRVLGVVEQSALRFADHAVTVTDQLKQRYVDRGADGDQISVVLNCAAPEGLLCRDIGGQREPGGFNVVCHGSIEDRYGQDTIIKAAHMLRGEAPDLRVILTGRGSGVPEILRMISDLRLDGTVRYEGWVDLPRLNEILASADVGIVAQKGSPYSHLVQTNKMVDYWIFGLPVVASRLDSISAMYDDSVIEYFEPGSPDSLARAIGRLYRDPSRRAQLAAEGKRAHEANGWAVQRKAYLAVYDRLLGSATPAGQGAATIDRSASSAPVRAGRQLVP